VAGKASKNLGVVYSNVYGPMQVENGSPDLVHHRLATYSSTPQILISYHAIGGYKLFDPSSNQMFISTDVYVDKSTSWTWTTIEENSNASKVLFEDESME